MKKSGPLVYLCIFVVTVLMVSTVVESHFSEQKIAHTYVTGKYAKYCYLNGKESKQITTKYYFPTLEACNKPLK